MIKIARVEPIAFIAARGILKVIAIRSFVIPSISNPVDKIIFGP